MTEQPPAMPASQTGSKIPKVLGIIHIVLASIGIATGLFGMSNAGMDNQLRDMVTDQFKSGKHEAEYQAAYAAMDKVMQVQTNQHLITVVLGLLLLAAGIMLLKKKKLGVKLTLGWAVARILSAIVIYFMASGAYAEFGPAFEKLMQANTGMDISMGAIAKTSLVVGAIVGMVYPIICLILLKKPSATAELS